MACTGPIRTFPNRARAARIGSGRKELPDVDAPASCPESAGLSIVLSDPAGPAMPARNPCTSEPASSFVVRSAFSPIARSTSRLDEEPAFENSTGSMQSRNARDHIQRSREWSLIGGEQVPAVDAYQDFSTWAQRAGDMKRIVCDAPTDEV